MIALLAALAGIAAALVPYIIERLRKHDTPEYKREVALDEFQKALVRGDSKRVSALLRDV